MPFPPYSYLPGHRPHPTKDPEGHSYGRQGAFTPPLDDATWSEHDDYLLGVVLFNRGYYWEAHEVWEGVWIACGRTGAVAGLLKGLIKLAAAGLKVRQDLGHVAVSMASDARGQFANAKALVGGEALCGLAYTDLGAYADHVEASVQSYRGDPSLPVEQVFSLRLCLAE